jgi:hypothetical protein
MLGANIPIVGATITVSDDNAEPSSRRGAKSSAPTRTSWPSARGSPRTSLRNPIRRPALVAEMDIGQPQLPASMSVASSAWRATNSTALSHVVALALW